MGVKGLHPWLQNECCEPNQADQPDESDQPPKSGTYCHMKKFRNQRIGIDTYVLLHRFIGLSAMDLLNGIENTQYVEAIKAEIRKIIDCGNNTVVAVFDGAGLPMKLATTIKRQGRRNEILQKATELLDDQKFSEAEKLFRQAIRINPQIAFTVMKALEEMGVECIVAPYEADAELAYLSKIGYIDVVFTIDSDLTVFGAKKIFFMSNKQEHEGMGYFYNLQDILEKITGKKNQVWSHLFLIQLCIFAGCDYLDNIPRYGFASALNDLQIIGRFDTLIDYLQTVFGSKLPPGYLEAFQKALMTFLYQWVFCPIQETCVPLNPYPIYHQCNPIQLEYLYLTNEIPLDEYLITKTYISIRKKFPNFEFLGPRLSTPLIQKIAWGLYNPHDKKPYYQIDNKDPSIWDAIFYFHDFRAFRRRQWERPFVYNLTPPPPLSEAQVQSTNPEDADYPLFVQLIQIDDYYIQKRDLEIMDDFYLYEDVRKIDTLAIENGPVEQYSPPSPSPSPSPLDLDLNIDVSFSTLF